METENEFGIERIAMHVRKFMRRFCLSLLIAVAFAGYSFTQDANSTTQSSQEDCLAAANSGGALPAGCSQGAGSTSGTMTRQQLDVAPVQAPQLTSGRSEPLERPIVPPVNPSQLHGVELPLRPQTEFEQIVADTIGRTLPLFGQTLFEQAPTTFALTDRMQVPSDYVVGTNDELQIRIWGQINADLRVVVDRSGQIYIPRVGQISVAGVHYSELEQHLKDQVLKVFRNFSLSVSIGRLRSIQVFVVGQARYPGTYTISSLSTLVNAIFASGGPTPQGSLRDIQVQRDGKTIAHMDFYNLLVKGDKSKDVRLQSGDVLYFPPVGPLVAIAGSVNTPGIYEVKHGSSLADLIEIADGLSTMADSNKVTVERIDDRHSRSVLEFPLDAQSRALPLSDGDIVRVLSIVPRFSDAVTLRGNVVNPGRYPWKPGMRIRDLIPDAQALQTRQYWLARATMTDGRSTEYPIRTKHSSSETSKTPDTRGQVARDFTARGTADRDSIGRDLTEQEAMRQTNSQDSSQARGTSTQFGRRNPNSETLTADLHQASPEINWNYAIIQRVNPEDLSTKLLSFDLGKAVLEGDAANNLELQPDDIITIFSQSDVSVPQSERARYIRLEGEVVRAGVYKVAEGELIRDVLRRAGGLTPAAYVYGTQMTRESARVEQQRSIDELTSALEAQIVQAEAAGAPSQGALIAQLRARRANGRVVLALNPAATSIDAYPAITLEDNDRIVIPHRPSTVSVVGMVYNSGSFVFDAHRKVGSYLRMAGKGKPGADMHHAFVLRADGTVVPSKSVNGLFSGDKFLALRLYPGDQIVIPNKIATGAFLRGLRDWTQVSSQLAITGAELAIIQ
jgi:protein involved in polysaccharide export with SLBB domain